METATVSGLSSKAAGVIAALGARFDPAVLQATRALFEGSWDMSLPTKSLKLSDLAYDTGARQTLDLYTSGQKQSPVLIYVPGGGFTGGDKSGYAHIGAAFARQGLPSRSLSAVASAKVGTERNEGSNSATDNATLVVLPAT
jgi:acetyl esterase/lipase